MGYKSVCLTTCIYTLDNATTRGVFGWVERLAHSSSTPTPPSARSAAGGAGLTRCQSAQKAQTQHIAKFAFFRAGLAVCSLRQCEHFRRRRPRRARIWPDRMHQTRHASMAVRQRAAVDGVGSLRCSSYNLGGRRRGVWERLVSRTAGVRECICC